MISKLLMKLGLGDGSLNADVDTRRRHIRFTMPQAVVEVAGQAYSMKDWSLGGVSFETLPDARLIVGDKVSFTLRFRFPHDTVSVSQQGRVVRTGKRGVAAEFAEVDPAARRDFDRVLDGIHTQGFLQTNVA